MTARVPPSLRHNRALMGERYDADGNRWCLKHHAYLPVTEFHTSPNGADGLSSYCRKCANNRMAVRSNSLRRALSFDQATRGVKKQ